MGRFYVDESIHDEAGFIIAACIYSEIDLAEKISAVILENGFDPSTFEHKSSAGYTKDPARIKIRSSLKGLLSSCQLGIVIIPRDNRDQLGYECLKGLRQFIDYNCHLSEPMELYFDQGIFTSVDKAMEIIQTLAFKGCTFSLKENSLLMPGIQIADLAAHISSIQLKAKMGLANKMVTIHAYGGYEAQEVELGFEMWATLRNCFFRQRLKDHDPTEDTIRRATVNIEPYGLYVSELCGLQLAEISKSCFAKVYLGCIH